MVKVDKVYFLFFFHVVYFLKMLEKVVLVTELYYTILMGKIFDKVVLVTELYYLMLMVLFQKEF